MHNFHLRNIDNDLMLTLKHQAAKQAISMNKFIIMLLKSVVHPGSKRTTIRHDFDEFSGSWTTAESKAFEKNTAHFSKIDKELWK